MCTWDVSILTVRHSAMTLFSRGYESEANGAGLRAKGGKPKDFSREFVVCLEPNL